MDAARFDTLTRLIGSRTSRRVLVGLAASGLLGIAVPDAEAAKCSNKKPCPECYQCKKHKCRVLTGTACRGGGTCQSGVCSPPPPPPYCTQTDSDPLNCQASGPQCICARSASGARVCVAFASWRENVFTCGACTGPGEICVNPNPAFDFAACAVLCANPR
jgi:hypothetical protein